MIRGDACGGRRGLMSSFAGAYIPISQFSITRNLQSVTTPHDARSRLRQKAWTNVELCWSLCLHKSISCYQTSAIRSSARMIRGDVCRCFPVKSHHRQGRCYYCLCLTNVEEKVADYCHHRSFSPPISF
ncbi:hypothetical protein J6590_053894 [Homalodisca vitripennis]|nr:hypothetical protein J6590_053894 [Homalodisca vitripennis]